MNLRASSGSGRNAGVALVIVMVAIFVLTMLAAAFAYSMKVETTLARRANSETELQWLGRSGVEFCRWLLVLQASCPAEPYDSLNQTWAGGSGGPCSTNGPLSEIPTEVTLGKGSFTWKIRDMERKANINSILGSGPALLEQGLLLMGVDATEQTVIVNSILDWIDNDKTVRVEGAESSFYESQTPSYEAKNGPIDDITELLFIQGVTPEIFWGPASTNVTTSALMEKLNKMARPEMGTPFTVGLVDLFTPISSGRININTASAEVLQMIPGVDELVAQAIVAGRQGEYDPSGLTGPYRTVEEVQRIPEVLPHVRGFLRQYCDVRSRTFEVEITARVAGSTRTFYAILVRPTPRDCQVVNFYWKY